MTGPAHDDDRGRLLVEVFDAAFAELTEADPGAMRAKYRKMAHSPHSFYRGSACLFYADVTGEEDPFVDDRTARIWIHGDLHAENFGTYLNSDGLLVFDVNDFDEAYVGHFTWDLQRFAASLALIGWQKALPEDEIRRLIACYAESYLGQVDDYCGTAREEDFALDLDNTGGVVHAALVAARAMRRSDLLDQVTRIEDGVRRFSDGPGVRRLEEDERERVVAAYAAYLDTIPADKRSRRPRFYELRDVVGKQGFGIGSAGLPAYSLLIDGFSQALDNDVVLTMKQANVPAVSRFVDTSAVDCYFRHEAQRTVISQRALQVHTDPLLGHAELEGTAYLVSEFSPYEVDLEWAGLVEPEEITGLVELLGKATAKVHCASDEDSEQDLVDFQVEEAVANALDGRRGEFAEWLTDWGIRYADRVRADHALFVDAFREGRIGVTSV